jgi:predicted flap endonuclease-1-like 5' DNA nuclease
MWIALAAVGLFGLLFGWSIRGILLVGKLRTARVDRDVAKTELEQARAEIEGLYAAQRNVATGATDPHIKAELNVREKRMTELSAELARSKAALESLKVGAGRGAAAAAPVLAKPAATGGVEEPPLLWRNRHLEGRVRHLEAALHDQASVPPGASPAATSGAIAAITAVTAGVAAEAAADTTEVDKLKWQTDFLKQRVEALEAELVSQPAPAVVAKTQSGNDGNEELARLRWRNRFLEGRVAYFEGDSTSAEADEPGLSSDETEAEAGELVSATDAILTELEEADAAADAEEGGVDLTEDEDDDGDADLDPDADEDLVEDEIEEEDEPDAEEDDHVEAEADVDEDDESGDEDEDEDGDADLDPDADEDLVEDEIEEEDEPDSEEDDHIEAEDGVDEDDESGDEESLDEDAEEDEYDEDLDEDDVPDDDELSEDEVLDDEVDDDDDDDDDEDIEDDDSEADDDNESDDDPLSDREQVDAQRPIALEKPVAGAPDDLTIIGGIGPKIQEVLNELGIFHYDQIAAWTPQNISWIDNHLNFSGRIAREGWVEQAAILSGDVAEE